MRILFTTQPGSGHWRPLAPLARALEQAGHEVAFAATPIFCRLIDEHGFRCFQVGFDDWLDSAATPSQPNLSDAASVYRHVFLPRSERHLPEVLARCREWRPDVIVREQSELAGYLAAELLGLPHVTLQVSAFRPNLDQSLAPGLGRLRTRLGLPPDSGLDRLYRDLLLLPFPPSMIAPGIAPPPSARFIQHLPFDRQHAGDEHLPDWVAALPSRPTVLATLGTAYSATPGLLPTILAGLANEPINLIATTNDQDPADFGDQPPHVHLVRYLPLSLLLPHCELVVTHGGSGTVRAALSFGVPLVILPIAADQPDNAQRCRELGVAHVVGPQERSPEAVRAACRRVLRDASFRRHALQLQTEFQSLPGLTSAVALIEHLLCSGESVESVGGRVVMDPSTALRTT